MCPYLALETCRQWRANSKTDALMKRGKIPMTTNEQAQSNYKKAINGGLKKILSKMGISLLSSYSGAQIFEIYGLGKDVVDYAFRGSVSRIGGLTLDELAKESVAFWVKGFSAEAIKKLDNFGFIQFRPGGEYHGNNPEMSKLLHKAVREKNPDAYAVYQEHLAKRPVNVSSADILLAPFACVCAASHASSVLLFWRFLIACARMLQKAVGKRGGSKCLAYPVLLWVEFCSFRCLTLSPPE